MIGKGESIPVYFEEILRKAITSFEIIKHSAMRFLPQKFPEKEIWEAMVRELAIPKT